MTITTADTFTVVVRDPEAGNRIKPYADVTAGRKLDMSREGPLEKEKATHSNILGLPLCFSW